MAETTNLYEELKNVLKDFKEFLDEKVPIIKGPIQQLANLIPQIVEVIDLLINLMNQIKTEIEKLDVSAIPGLSDVSEFTQKITGFLDTASDLIPDDAEDTVAEIRSAINIVGSLPSLEQVKQEILTLIGQINGHLASLKPAS